MSVPEQKVIELFDLSEYANSLPATAKDRYIQKLAAIDIDCPYKIEKIYWLKDEDVIKILPDFTYVDLLTYIMYTKSEFTKENLKAYKSLDAYKRLTDKLFGSLEGIKLNNKISLFRGKVAHSMSLLQNPLYPWVAIANQGTVLGAHCTCAAGLGEVCSHIATLLFAIEALVDMKNAVACTEEKCAWLCRYKKPVLVNRTAELDTSVKHGPKNTSKIPEVSDESWSIFQSQLAMEEIPSALLLISPEYARHYVPLAAQVALPLPMTSLYDPSCVGKELQFLKIEAEMLLHRYNVTEQQMLIIEKLTRQQSASRYWNEYREGRATASKVGSIMRTSVRNPSKSIILETCYPGIKRGNCDATSWGMKNESIALRRLETYIQEHGRHTDFKLQQTGLRISISHPYIAASPDSLLVCPCHGTTVVEVKCPYKHRNNTILTAAKEDKDFCLCVEQNGILRLKENHNYFFQCQTQMFVCNTAFCLFAVYTLIDFVCIPVFLDNSIVDSVVSRCKMFVLEAVMPELIGKHQTKNVKFLADKENLQAVSNFPICFCGNPESTSKTVKCANPNCRAKEIHVDCLLAKGKKRFRHGWMCDTCRKELRNKSSVENIRMPLSELNK